MFSFLLSCKQSDSVIDVIDTAIKFSAGVVGNLPPVSNQSISRKVDTTGFLDTGGKYAACVICAGGVP